ncbi:Transmembrane protein 62 [Dinochytrium kinnereticum]|nr:Transmembrane protein 62 [Dinochytrium kinnereticum]
MAARGVLFRHNANTDEKVDASVDMHQDVASFDPVLSDSVDNLFTFVQISDLHISRYNSHGGLPHVQSFFENELPLIGPDLMLVTGDLIDAKSKSKLESVQYMDEWLAYEKLLNVSGVALRNNGTFYWDMRGNHDCFNLGADFNETEFGRMSAVRSEGYRYLHKKSFGSYDFLGIDLCPEVGTARPFNFFGTMDGNDMDILASVVDAADSEHRNHTFVATHYPTAVTISGKSRDGRGLSELAKGVSLWMSGHLHQLILGLGKTMYTYHRTPGMLELELGDMKDHAVYRIVAVDNDMISFTDEVVSLPELPMPAPPLGSDSAKLLVSPLRRRDDGDSTDLLSHKRNVGSRGGKKKIPPVVVVTNPRDARFASPTREPSKRILSSTHIRMLIYSRSTVSSTNISIKIDGAETGIKGALRAKGSENYPAWQDKLPLDPGPDSPKNHLPLWVAPWNPTIFDDGRDHVMDVRVTDDEGEETVKRVVFRVDGSRSGKRMGLTTSGTLILSVRFPLLVRLALMFSVT